MSDPYRSAGALPAGDLPEADRSARSRSSDDRSAGDRSADPARSVRAARIADGLERVRRRIRDTCARAGRDPGGVTLIVVTKTYPASDVLILADLGVADVGENRDAEAGPKHELCAGAGLRWHFIGQLQSNKAARVARYADVVHSVDRSSVVRALGHGARRAGRTIACLVQVSLDGDPTRGGARIEDLPALADAVAAEPGLVLGGIMAVAPVAVPPLTAFAPLPALSREVRRSHPEARTISAGMSGDLEAALRHGATHLRVGTAVLGERPSLG